MRSPSREPQHEQRERTEGGPDDEDAEQEIGYRRPLASLPGDRGKDCALTRKFLVHCGTRFLVASLITGGVSFGAPIPGDAARPAVGVLWMVVKLTNSSGASFPVTMA